MTEISDETIQEYRDEAEALRKLAEDLSSADSIAEDVPVLSELFHEARTSRRKARDGRYVALLDRNGMEWTCRSVSFLERGTHYMDTGADLSISHKPQPFLSADDFAEDKRWGLEMKIEAAEQNAADLERTKKEAQRRTDDEKW